MMVRFTAHSRRLRGLGMVVVALAILCLMAPPLSIRNGAYQLYRAAAWQKVRWERHDMAVLSSDLVRVYHDRDDRHSAAVVLALFQQYQSVVDREYGYVSGLPVQVVIYPSRRSLAASMGWSSGDSALGVYWGGSIKLLSPAVWLAGKSEAEMERIYRQNGPVVHEYTHFVIDRLSSGNIPRWLTEGLAQVEEQRLTGYLWLEQSSVIRDDNLYDLQEMDVGFDRLANQPLAYHQSYTLARFLVEREGQSKVNTLLRELGHGYTLDQAFRRVTGDGFVEFQREWRGWVLTEYQGAS